MKKVCPNCGFEGEIFDSKKCARCGEIIPASGLEDSEVSGRMDRFSGRGRQRVNFRDEMKEDAERVPQTEDDLEESQEPAEEFFTDRTYEIDREEDVFAQAGTSDEPGTFKEPGTSEEPGTFEDAVAFEKERSSFEKDIGPFDEERVSLEETGTAEEKGAFEGKDGPAAWEGSMGEKEAFDEEDRTAPDLKTSSMQEPVLPEETVPDERDKVDGVEEAIRRISRKINAGGILYPRIPVPSEQEEVKQEGIDRPLKEREVSEPIQEDLPLYEEPVEEFVFPKIEADARDIMKNRLWAGLIDIGLVLAMNVLAFVFISLFARLDVNSYLLLPVYPFLIIAFLMTTGYFVFFSGFSGQTPGKMLMHLQVIDQSGNLISFSRSFARYLGYYISLLSLGYGFFAAFSDPKHKAWHDRIAGTRVEFIGEKE